MILGLPPSYEKSTSHAIWSRRSRPCRSAPIETVLQLVDSTGITDDGTTG